MSHLDEVPFSGIIRIRDMMYAVREPFRLDQGDVSFDVPESLKQAMHAAIDANRTHYLQTAGVPRLLELLAGKLRAANGVPIGSPDEVMVTNGGIHGLYLVFQALLDPGDEVILPNPGWPAAAGNVVAARGVPVGCPLHEERGWRFDLDELESRITPRTRVIYINSPHNPTGGVLTRADLERIAALVRAHDLWLVSDEAYEHVLFDGAEHVSPASLPGMYDRTIPVYTFSKSYAATGLRLGYLAVKDERVRERLKKALFYTTSNVSSIVQFGAIGALEGSQACIAEYRDELQARRDYFYRSLPECGTGVLTGAPPKGAFYAFVRIDSEWQSPDPDAPISASWAIAQHLISRGRIGCVPGVDFGSAGEGYVRFCFARDRRELSGALASMQTTLSATA